MTISIYVHSWFLEVGYSPKKSLQMCGGSTTTELKVLRSVCQKRHTYKLLLDELVKTQVAFLLPIFVWLLKGSGTSSSVQSLSCVQLFVTPWTTARQASLSITNSRSLLKLMSIELVMASNHLIPFSACPQSFPTSGSFQMSQLFASGDQSIGVSALTSVLPTNTQD